jgi:hypothetical protein
VVEQSQRLIVYRVGDGITARGSPGIVIEALGGIVIDNNEWVANESPTSPFHRKAEGYLEVDLSSRAAKTMVEAEPADR